MFKIIMLAFMLSTPMVQAFTYNDIIEIPKNQVCDNWDSVSHFNQAVIPVIQPGETRKIRIKVPENTNIATISFKSHASKPSVVINTLNHTEPFYIEPRLGSHISKAFSNVDNYIYIYHNSLSNEENLGPSTMTTLSASFNLTIEECNKRAGNNIPDKVITEPLYVRPILLRDDMGFHLNQLQYGDKIFSVSFEFTGKIGDNYHFKTTNIRDIIDISEDYDSDGYNTLYGDCNDDDPSINPNNKNCNL